MKWRQILILIVMAAICLSTSCDVNRYQSPEAFMEQYSTLETDEKLIELCRDYMDHISDHNFTLLVLAKWRDIDVESARDYFQVRVEKDSLSTRNRYLLGLVTEDPVQRVIIGRELVEMAPAWQKGYELILETYSDVLFPIPRSEGRNHPLFAMLPKDNYLFTRYVDLAPKNPDHWRYLYEYRIYSKSYEKELKVLERVSGLPGNWVNRKLYADLYARMGDVDKAKKLMKQYAGFEAAAGRIDTEDKQYFIDKWTVKMLLDAGAYKEVIKYIKQIKKWDLYLQNYIDLANAHAMLGEKNRAFDLLNKTVRYGWSSVRSLQENNSLDSLKNDNRWQPLIAEVRKNRNKEAGEREKAILANRVEKPAFEWTMSDGEGNSVSLSDLQGRIVVLNFWAIECEDCDMTMAEVDTFAKKYAGDNLAVFSVAAYGRGIKRHCRFMKEKGYSIPLLFANIGILKQYEIEGVSQTRVLDREGKLRFEIKGYEEGFGESLVWMMEALKLIQ